MGLSTVSAAAAYLSFLICFLTINNQYMQEYSLEESRKEVIVA